MLTPITTMSIKRLTLCICAGFFALGVICATALKWQEKALQAEIRDRELRLEEEKVRPKKIWERE